MKQEWILAEVDEEIASAISKHSAMNSAHEGWAVIYEELDELWEVVRMNTHQSKGIAESRKSLMRKEAIQVAAMAVRFIMDVCDKEDK